MTSHPDDLERYRLKGERPTDGALPRWCNYWQIVELFMSPASFCALLHPRQERELSAAVASEDRDAEVREELRELLRFVHQIAKEFDGVPPLAGIVQLDGRTGQDQVRQRVDAPSSEARESSVCDRLRRWSADQEWHRGDFALYVVVGVDAAQKRLADLLGPLPSRWQSAEAPEPTSSATVLRKAATALERSSEVTSDGAHGGGDDAADAHPSPLQAWRGEIASELKERAADLEESKGKQSTELLGNWLAEKIDARVGHTPDPRQRERAGAVPTPSLREALKRKRAPRDRRDGRPRPRVQLPRAERISRVRIEGFRGFGAPFPPESGRDDPESWLDVDADIVLIVGPNGTGKTSFIEALAYGLTGYHFHGDHTAPNGPESPSAGSAPLRAHPAGEDYSQVLRHVMSSSASKPEGRVDLRVQVPAPESKVREAAPGNEEAGPESKLAFVSASAGQGIVHSTAQASEGSPDLQARLTTYLADRLDHLFDETTHATTIREVFEELPPEVRELVREDGDLSLFRDELERAVEALNAREDRQSSRQDGASPQAIGRALLKLETTGYHQMRGIDSSLPAPPASLEHRLAEEAETGLSAFTRAIAEAIGSGVSPEGADPTELEVALRNARHATLRELRGAAREHVDAQALEVLLRRRDEIESRDQELAEQYGTLQRLRQKVALFEAPPQSALPSLEAILVALRDLRDSWLGARPALSEAESAQVGRVFAELERVQPGDAADLIWDLERAFAPLRAALAEWEALRREHKTVEQQIRAAERSSLAAELVASEGAFERAVSELTKAWWELRASEERQETLGAVHDLKMRYQAGRELVDALWEAFDNATQPSKDLQKAIETCLAGVHERFLHGGSSPLEIRAQHPEKSSGGDADRRYYRLEAADGRRLSMLSAGQRSQLGIAYLLAQNAVAGGELAHRVLFIDDVSASYDLANLSRECVMWRQIAYAADDNHPLRRQLILSSHHEDLSNLLIDALAPPTGRRMLVYRFVDWRQGEGPEVEGWEVEPSELGPLGSYANDALTPLADWIWEQLECTSSA